MVCLQLKNRLSGLGIDNLPTTLATITSQNAVNNTCIIKGNNLGSVKLWCKSVDEEIVSQDGMVIQVKSLFQEVIR